MISTAGRTWQLLVFQHHPAEHAGRFGVLAEADGAEITTVRLDAGQPVPAVRDFDAVWALGGPMQVWEESIYPWLVTEKAAIREAVVDRGMPFLGLCLGHQLLADSLGGRVGPSETPEAGVLPVELTEAGRDSPFLRDIGDRQFWIQGHGAEVQAPPDGAVVLARSPACQIQALSWGTRAVSFQFHCEMTLEMVDGCLEHPAYAADFETLLGQSGIAEFRRQVIAAEEQFRRTVRILYRNWKRTAFAVIPRHGTAAT